jgi:hypothetical protein
MACAIHLSAYDCPPGCSGYLHGVSDEPAPAASSPELSAEAASVGAGPDELAAIAAGASPPPPPRDVDVFGEEQRIQRDAVAEAERDYRRHVDRPLVANMAATLLMGARAAPADDVKHAVQVARDILAEIDR